MEFISEYGLFLAKAITIVIAIGVVLGLIMSAGHKGKQEKGHIEVTKLNEKLDKVKEDLEAAILNEGELKLHQKELKKQTKEKHKQEKQALKEAKKQEKQEPSDKKDTNSESSDYADELRARVFVLKFDGDIKASAVENLREEITALLSLAKPADEVVVCIESGGGMVHSYGLASSQLSRITSRQIPLTVCVDKVAASGGYMMACVADKILAAPFAILGSIGVVAQLPNFHRLLQKNDIDFELLTAGENKRTLTMFGENTDKGREKFMEDLEDTHELFKSFVSENRPAVDIDKVANGDVWFGRRAIDQNLVDELVTSDEYIVSRAAKADVFNLEFVHKKSLQEKIGMSAESSVDRLLLRWLSRIQTSRFFS